MAEYPDHMRGPTEPGYVYRARVRSIYDGDTWRVDIDCGFKMWLMNEPIRLAGIDTPEVRGEERPHGLIVRDFCRAEYLGKLIIVRTHRGHRGKYGRWIAEVFVDGISVNELLVERGMARRVDWG